MIEMMQSPLALSMRTFCFQDASNFYAHLVLFMFCASSRRQRVSAGLQSLESKFLASAVFVIAASERRTQAGLQFAMMTQSRPL